MDDKNTVTLKRAHTVQLLSRKEGNLTGVEKVISSSETALVLATADGGLTVCGSGLKINHFDAGDGTLRFEGTVNSLKYSAAKVPVLKRIFK